MLTFIPFILNENRKDINIRVEAFRFQNSTPSSESCSSGKNTTVQFNPIVPFFTAITGPLLASQEESAAQCRFKTVWRMNALIFNYTQSCRKWPMKRCGMCRCSSWSVARRICASGTTHVVSAQCQRGRHRHHRHLRHYLPEELRIATVFSVLQRHTPLSL